MKMRITSILFILLGFSRFAEGQGAGIENATNSLTASAAANGGNVSVDMSRGLLGFNLPLVTLPSSSGAGVSLGLSYIGGQGIKAAETAPAYGIGWKLTGLGQISREVRGIPDEKAYQEQIYPTDHLNHVGWLGHTGLLESGHLSTIEVQDLNGNTISLTTYDEYGQELTEVIDCSELHLINQFSYNVDMELHAHRVYEIEFSNSPTATVGELVDFYSSETPPAGISIGKWKMEQRAFFFSLWSDNKYSNYKLDPEPDLFTAEGPGFSFQFVFNKHGIPIVLDQPDILVSPKFGPEGNGVDWVVHLPNGVMYRYSTVEMTKIEYGNTGSANENNTEYPVKWLLNRIEYPDGNNVEITYQPVKKYVVETPSQFYPNYINGQRMDMYKDCSGNDCDISFGSLRQYVWHYVYDMVHSRF